MNKEASKLYDEFFDKWINIFVPDEGDNRLECEYGLHKFIEALQEDKWISVEDELPKDNNNDEDREFIVEIEIKHSCVYPVTSAQWDRKEQRFYKGIEYLKVIRWQPLPKPPITNKPKKRGGCNP